MIVLFIIMEIGWTAYTIWTGKRLEAYCGKKAEQKKLSETILVTVFATLIVSALCLISAVVFTAFLLGDSQLTYFLVSALAALSLISIIAVLEMRWKLEFGNN